MNKINKILTYILCCSILVQWLPHTYAQDLTLAKQSLLTYFDSWFNSEDEEWLLEVNGIKIPSYGIDVGLNALEERLKSAKVSKDEQKQVRDKFITTYIDQSIILAVFHKDLIDSPNLDILLQEFLRQVTTQLWLENEVAKDLSAVEPTEDEVNEYYLANSERLFRLGLTASQIKEYTEQELKQQKVQLWTVEQLNAVKSKYKPTINPKFMKKYSIK